MRVYATRDVESTIIYVWATRPLEINGRWQMGELMARLSRAHFEHLAGFSLRPGEARAVEVEVREADR